MSTAMGLGVAAWLVGPAVAATAPAEPAETAESVAPAEPVEAPAAPPAAPQARRTWTVGAFVDTAYVYDSNRPDNHLYRGAFTTPRTGEFTINLAAVHLKHGSSDAEPWRLQLALQAGAAADALYEPEPIPGGADGRLAGPEVFKHIGLANAGFRIRRTRTRVEGGLMTSPLGIGGLWSKDNWNYSPSWAANAAPYYLAGGRIIQDIAGGFGAHAWIVNGWQTMADVNAVPSYLVGIHYEDDDLAAYTQVYFGSEDVSLAPRYWRVHLDSWFVYNRERFGVGAVFDGGHERVARPTGDDMVYWLGTAGFFRARVWQPTERIGMELAARPELFWDKDGRLFGVPQALAAATGTVGLDLYGYLLLRAEYRYDHSTAYAGFFYRGEATNDASPDLATDQHTVFLSVIGHIEHAFAVHEP